MLLRVTVMLYSSPNQRLKSISLQRFEQNGKCGFSSRGGRFSLHSAQRPCVGVDDIVTTLHVDCCMMSG